jgi:hypothetical protein
MIVPDALRRPIPTQRPPATSVKLFCIVEGANDIQFLMRISRIMSQAQPNLPNLAKLQVDGKLAILPRGGGDILVWADRLAPLGAKQFHLSDREVEPECHMRRKSAQVINCRNGCRAVISRKRALENYLHPAAIFDARGLEVEFGDEDDAADIVACRLFTVRTLTPSWDNCRCGLANAFATERRSGSTLRQSTT